MGTGWTEEEGAVEAPVQKKPDSSRSRFVFDTPAEASPPPAEEAAPLSPVPAAARLTSGPAPEYEPLKSPAAAPVAEAAQEQPAVVEDNFFTPPVGAPGGTDEESLPWESLAADTADPRAAADTQPKSLKRAAAARPGAISSFFNVRLSRRQLWLIGAGAAVALGSLLLLLWWTFSGDNPEPVSKVRYFKVNPSGRDGEFRSVREALSKARVGDHIVLLDDVEEQLDLSNAKYVTIEADPARTIVWRAPEKRADDKKLLWLSEAEGVRLQGLAFDGRDRVDRILLLTGLCDGLVINHVTFRGFKHSGILFNNCAGRSDRPITLQNLSFAANDPKDAGIAFDLNPNVLPKVNQHITIGDCEFSGPFQTKVSIPKSSMVFDVTVNPAWLKSK
jgi:hypothetical protein